MAGEFQVFTSSAFDRNLKRLVKKHPDIPTMFEKLVSVLQTDPQNISQKHDIKKLVNVSNGEGQWRIRSGVYRLRYDVEGRMVHLYSINHRSEAY